MLIKPDSIFLETNRFDLDNHRSFLFAHPVEIIQCMRLEEVRASICKLEGLVSKGYYAAGFISYEAGLSFEDSLKSLFKKPDNFPLLWFGVYKDPVISYKKNDKFTLGGNAPYIIKNFKANVSKHHYTANVDKIKAFIEKGDTYQVNYTFKYNFDFLGDPLSLYRDLSKKQSVSYASFIDTDDFSIISISPELFIRKNGLNIEVRPMKGTFCRGRHIEEDAVNMEKLKTSLKDRSENVMIVDLLRNDLGRISEPGSVKTKTLFEVEKYETLFQMVSVIKSKLKKNVSMYELLKAVFPSGSVTGAPKISTMKIIDSLENEPRKIYTGSIGFIAPDGESIFNVAIRTLLVDKKKKKGEMGIGSGIVYDSDSDREFAECRLKADFINSANKKDFKLIETMLWENKKYALLKLHLDRLSRSSKYFGFKYNKASVLKALAHLAKKFNIKHRYRVRLVLDKDGFIGITCSKIYISPNAKKVKFSNKRVSSKNIFLYHKTTNREYYESEYKKWHKAGFFDIIFINELGEVTEGAISNIVLRKGSLYYTPPASSGLLEGVFRRALFEDKRFSIIEKVLYKKDVLNADEIFMVNSVRGMAKVECVKR